MKKILSLILAALMTASCAAFVAADDAAVEEAAVEATADAAVEEVAVDPAQKYAIEFLAEYGIFKGTSATEMVADADADIQRYQMALFVSRISTGWVEDEQWEDGPANNSKFDDINEEPAGKYLGALSYANQEGIIEGYSATKFAPYDSITYRDALTMVCRTLGYKGLNYPWGYIQTAVELGLNKNVDAAYTDTLTRGEVAVIIYNAMFAEKKAGGTLAKSIFDVDFKWETIVIVSSDEAGFDVIDTTDKWNKNADRAPAGYIGFKILDANGNLSAKTYFVAEDEMGLDEGHDAELAVGSAYIALFEADKDIVKMISYDSQNFATIVNRGITDNAGDAVATMPIVTELAKYELVKDSYSDQYISFMGDELKIYSTATYNMLGQDGNKVGIDMATGNLLNLTDDGTWVIGWYYNEDLNRYYRYYFDDDSTVKAYTDKADHISKDATGAIVSPYTNVSDIVIDWMSDADFEKWYKDAVEYVIGTETRYVQVESLSDFGKDPYATLKLYDTDVVEEDNKAEVATYRKYSIGYFSTHSTEKCTVKANNVDHSGGVYMPKYKITTMDGTTVFNEFVEANHEAHDPNYKANIARGNGFAWLNVADDVEGFENADGSYKNGVVLYDTDKTTGEIEIVKYIPETGSTDEDSFIISGVLQAYSTKNTSMTIDGVTYYYGYDKPGNANGLAGIADAMMKRDGNIADRSKSAGKLDSLLMQYVSIVVCDGLVVDIEAVGAKTDDVIVVVDYAGITSDNYIAVYGYSAKDPTLKLFKINSYNGWKQGDYRYNPWNAQEDEAFAFGTIYSINSYDAATQSYGVYTFAEPADFYGDLSTQIKIEFKGGYRIISKWDGSKYVESAVEPQKNTDSYLMIHSTTDDMPGFVNYVTGRDIENESLEITGKQLYNNNAGNIILVGGTVYGTVDGVNAVKNYLNTNVGFVLYDKSDSRVLEAAYDDAQVEDIYLLGSTLSEVRVINLLTGAYEYVIKANNIDLEDGTVYMTIDGMFMGVVAENVLDDSYDVLNHTKSLQKFFGVMDANYGNHKSVADVDDLGNNGAYIYLDDQSYNASAAKITKDNLKLEIAKQLMDIDPTWSSTLQNKIAAQVVSSVTILDVKVSTSDWVKNLDELAAEKIYAANVLYNTSTGAAVVYILDELASGTVSTDVVDKTFGDDTDNWVVLDDGTTTQHINTEVVLDWSGKKTAKLDKDGKPTDDTVAATIDKLYFGYAYIDECDHANGHTSADCPYNGTLIAKPADSFFEDEDHTNKVLGKASMYDDTVSQCHDVIEMVVWYDQVTDTKSDYYYHGNGKIFDYRDLSYTNVGEDDKYVSMVTADIQDFALVDGAQLYVRITLDRAHIANIRMIWNAAKGAFDSTIERNDLK